MIATAPILLALLHAGASALPSTPISNDETWIGSTYIPQGTYDRNSAYYPHSPPTQQYYPATRNNTGSYQQWLAPFEIAQFVETPFTEFQAHDLFYLDRQTPACPANTLMGGFQLRTNNGAMSYTATCAKITGDNALGACETQKTAFSFVDKTKVYALDKQTVSCARRDQAISAFRLVRAPEDPNQWVNYDVACCAVPGLSAGGLQACAEYATQPQPDGDGSVDSLGRHSVRCPADRVLTRFKLARNAEKKELQIQFTCCARQ